MRDEEIKDLLIEKDRSSNKSTSPTQECETALMEFQENTI